MVDTRSRSEKVLIYPDAIEKYGLRLERKDLDKAYERAGRSFPGQLAHQFVMLFDEEEAGDREQNGPREGTSKLQTEKEQRQGSKEKKSKHRGRRGCNAKKETKQGQINQ